MLGPIGGNILRILALVPDPRSAYGLAEALAALPRPSLRVVAYGQAAAAALPAGLDVIVYPVREGSVLPAPFLDALIMHEAADVLLAPAGAVPAPPVPALVVDLDHSVPAEKVVPKDEPGQASWIEALTDDVERRRALLRAGLFSVELNPGAFERAGRLAGSSASAILGRLIDMAGLSTRPQPRKPTYPRPVDAVNSAAPLPEAPPLARPHVAPVITAPVAPIVPVAPLVPVKPLAPVQPPLSAPLVVKPDAPLAVKPEPPLAAPDILPIVKIVQVTAHPPAAALEQKVIENEDVTEPFDVEEPAAPAKSAFSLVTPSAPVTNAPVTNAPVTNAAVTHAPVTNAPSTPFSIPMTAGAFTPILSTPSAPITPSAPSAPAAPVAHVAHAAPAGPTAPIAPVAPAAATPASPADAPRGPAVPVDERESAGLYRDRCRGGRVLVLASATGLDGLGAALLGEATVIAVPESVAWLSSRMGLAQFVCATAQPRTLEAAAATSAVRTVLVHADHLDGATIAPRARARVAVRDLSRGGWPALGWSDELETGYFPGPGDIGLALQWASWIGASEIVLAGTGPLETRPSWPEFLAGAAELLAARETRVVILGTQAAPSLPQAEVRDRFTRWGSGRG